MKIKNEVLVVASNKIGKGEKELGEVLAKSYFYTLSESETLPKAILFLNSGVKLTAQNADVAEYLKKMEKEGTEIASCGTCLDYYGLKDRLIAGKITNMYDIVAKMQGSDKVITLS